MHDGGKLSFTPDALKYGINKINEEEKKFEQKKH